MVNQVGQLPEWVANFLPGAAVAFAVVVIALVVKRMIYMRLRQFDQRELVDAVADQIDKIGWETVLITAIYVGLNFVGSSGTELLKIFYFLFIVVWSWQAIQLTIGLINFGIERLIARGENSNVSAYKFLGAMLKALVWIIVALTILSNLGYDVTSLVAGLGISGIAVALAVQSVLGDFISSLSIVADKPFRVGDVIRVNGFVGRVRKIGVRSTLVKSLDGEDLIIPNSELVKTTIQNFGSVTQRRSLHQIGITYETDPKLVKDIPVFVYDILRELENVSDEGMRMNLIKYADSALVFELAFEVTVSDYNEFLQIQEQALLKIMDKFAEEGINFAYPTQTVYEHKLPDGPNAT